MTFNSQINLDIVAKGLDQTLAKLNQLNQYSNQLSNREINIGLKNFASGVESELKRLSSSGFSTNFTVNTKLVLDKSSVQQLKSQITSELSTTYASPQQAIASQQRLRGLVTDFAKNMEFFAQGLANARQSIAAAQVYSNIPSYRRAVLPAGSRLQPIPARISELRDQEVNFVQRERFIQNQIIAGQKYINSQLQSAVDRQIAVQTAKSGIAPVDYQIRQQRRLVAQTQSYDDVFKLIQLQKLRNELERISQKPQLNPNIAYPQQFISRKEAELLGIQRQRGPVSTERTLLEEGLAADQSIRDRRNSINRGRRERARQSLAKDYLRSTYGDDYVDFIDEQGTLPTLLKTKPFLRGVEAYRRSTNTQYIDPNSPFAKTLGISGGFTPPGKSLKSLFGASGNAPPGGGGGDYFGGGGGGSGPGGPPDDPNNPFRRRSLIPDFKFNKRNFLNENVLRQIFFGLVFGGPLTAAGAAIGGGFAGASGALFGSTASQFLKNTLTSFGNNVHDASEKIREAGLAFERSILGISAVNQANKIIVGPNGEEVSPAAQFNFQQVEAKRIQLAARSKLLPLGIAGQTESTFVQGIVSALAQRGLSGSDQQVARISELLGGAIQAQRPSLLENTTLLLRDIQDVLGGGPLASRTVLSQLIKPSIGGLQNAKSIEDVVKSLEKLSAFPEIAKGLDNPIVSLNKLSGALDNLQTVAGDVLLKTMVPAIDAFTKELTEEDTLKAAEVVGKTLGEMTAVMFKVGVQGVKLGKDLSNGLLDPLTKATPILFGLTSALTGLGAAASFATARTRAETIAEDAKSIALAQALLASKQQTAGVSLALGSQVLQGLSTAATAVGGENIKLPAVLKGKVGQVGTAAGGISSLNLNSFGKGIGGAIGKVGGKGLGILSTLLTVLSLGSAFGAFDALGHQQQNGIDKDLQEAQKNLELGGLSSQPRFSQNIESRLKKLGLEKDLASYVADNAIGPSTQIRSLKGIIGDLADKNTSDLSKGTPELYTVGPFAFTKLAAAQKAESERRISTLFDETSTKGAIAAGEETLKANLNYLDTLDAKVTILSAKKDLPGSKEGLEAERRDVLEAKKAAKGTLSGLVDDKEQLLQDYGRLIDPKEKELVRRKGLAKVQEIDKVQASIDAYDTQLLNLGKGINGAIKESSDELDQAKKEFADGMKELFSTMKKIISSKVAAIDADIAAISPETAGGRNLISDLSNRRTLRTKEELIKNIGLLDRRRVFAEDSGNTPLKNSLTNKIDDLITEVHKTTPALVSHDKDLAEVELRKLEDINKTIDKTSFGGQRQALENEFRGLLRSQAVYGDEISEGRLRIDKLNAVIANPNSTDTEVKLKEVDLNLEQQKLSANLQRQAEDSVKQSDVGRQLAEANKAEANSKKELETASEKVRDAINNEALTRSRLNLGLEQSIFALQEFRNQARLRELQGTTSQVGPVQDFIRKYGYAPAGAPSEVLSAAQNPSLLRDLERQQAEEQIGAAGRAFDNRGINEKIEEGKLETAVETSRKAFDELTESINNLKKSLNDLIEKRGEREKITFGTDARNPYLAGVLPTPKLPYDPPRTRDADGDPVPRGLDLTQVLPLENDTARQLKAPGNVVPAYKPLPNQKMQEGKYDSVSSELTDRTLQGGVSTNKSRYYMDNPVTGQREYFNLGEPGSEKSEASSTGGLLNFVAASDVSAGVATATTKYGNEAKFPDQLPAAFGREVDVPGYQPAAFFGAKWINDPTYGWIPKGWDPKYPRVPIPPQLKKGYVDPLSGKSTGASNAFLNSKTASPFDKPKSSGFSIDGQSSGASGFTISPMLDPLMKGPLDVDVIPEWTDIGGAYQTGIALGGTDSLTAASNIAKPKYANETAFPGQLPADYGTEVPISNYQPAAFFGSTWVNDKTYGWIPKGWTPKYPKVPVPPQLLGKGMSSSKKPSTTSSGMSSGFKIDDGPSKPSFTIDAAPTGGSSSSPLLNFVQPGINELGTISTKLKGALTNTAKPEDFNWDWINGSSGSSIFGNDEFIQGQPNTIPSLFSPPPSEKGEKSSASGEKNMSIGEKIDELIKVVKEGQKANDPVALKGIISTGAQEALNSVFM